MLSKETCYLIFAIERDIPKQCWDHNPLNSDMEHVCCRIWQYATRKQGTSLSCNVCSERAAIPKYSNPYCDIDLFSLLVSDCQMWLLLSSLMLLYCSECSWRNLKHIRPNASRYTNLILIPIVPLIQWCVMSASSLNQFLFAFHLPNIMLYLLKLFR